MREQVIHETHESSSHSSKDTLEKIRRSFYWPNADRDVRSYLVGCTSCQQRKDAARTRKLPIGVTRAYHPNSIVAIDLVALPMSQEGYNYALVAMCLFTKFVSVAPLRSKTSEEVLEAFERCWTQEHG
jgi:hypothetical protein